MGRGNFYVVEIFKIVSFYRDFHFLLLQNVYSYQITGIKMYMSENGIIKKKIRNVPRYFYDEIVADINLERVF